MTDRTVSIVIPALDGGTLLRRCVEQVDPARPHVQLIVVDNGSTDGSVETVKAKYPATTVIRNDANRGYAPACNQGAAVATGDYILFLNTDAFLEANALDALVDAAHADGSGAIWQPVNVNTEGELDSAGDLFTWWGILKHAESLTSDAPIVRVFATMGAALLVRRDAFERLGGFDESYFAYYEESDLCWRARLVGYEVGVAAGVVVEHVGGATTARIFPPEDVRYLAFRNRWRTILANAERRSRMRLVPQHALVCLAFVLLYTVTLRWRSAAAVVRATAWPIGHRDLLREQRARVQGSRTITDAELLRPELVTSFSPAAVWRHLRKNYRGWEAASERAEGLHSQSTRKN